ncbi:MAG: hypothetical protein WC389_12775 [Lutibacter sp.]|jgi:hypothetical protein
MEFEDEKTPDEVAREKLIFMSLHQIIAELPMNYESAMVIKKHLCFVYDLGYFRGQIKFIPTKSGNKTLYKKIE